MHYIQKDVWKLQITQHKKTYGQQFHWEYARSKMCPLHCFFNKDAILLFLTTSLWLNCSLFFSPKELSTLQYQSFCMPFKNLHFLIDLKFLTVKPEKSFETNVMAPLDNIPASALVCIMVFCMMRMSFWDVAALSTWVEGYCSINTVGIYSDTTSFLGHNGSS